MKDLLVQVCIKPKKEHEVKGNKNTLTYEPTIYELAVEKGREYADKIGVDYHLINSYEFSDLFQPQYQRFALFGDKYKEYDQIVYCDGDYVFVPETAPNIFDLMRSSDKDFFAVPERRENLHKKNNTIRKIMEQADIDFSFKYFNSGFMGFKREFIDSIRMKTIYEVIDITPGTTYKDQNAINLLVYHSYMRDYHELSRDWNGVMATKSPLYSIHYVALRKKDFSFEKHEKLVQDKINRIASL